MHHKPYAARDLFKRPLAESELRELAGRAGGPRAIFSWRSPSAKPLHLDEATVSDDELIALMLREPRLIRRPLLTVNDGLLIQPSPEALQKAVGD